MVTSAAGLIRAIATLPLAGIAARGAIVAAIAAIVVVTLTVHSAIVSLAAIGSLAAVKCRTVVGLAAAAGGRGWSGCGRRPGGRCGTSHGGGRIAGVVVPGLAAAAVSAIVPVTAAAVKAAVAFAVAGFGETGRHGHAGHQHKRQTGNGQIGQLSVHFHPHLSMQIIPKTTGYADLRRAAIKIIALMPL